MLARGHLREARARAVSLASRVWALALGPALLGRWVRAAAAARVLEARQLRAAGGTSSPSCSGAVLHSQVGLVSWVRLLHAWDFAQAPCAILLGQLWSVTREI